MAKPKSANNERPSKRELTRQRVIDAAVTSIYQDGFNAAHTNRIAEAAGVSWGVLQYHFGDKDGLLQAVLDQIFDDFFDTLSRTELTGNTLHERVRELIDAIWGLVSGKEYRVSIAILRNAGKDDTSRINGQKQVNAWARKVSTLWLELLGDDTRQSADSEAARHLLFAALRGLADDIGPRGEVSKRSWKAERSALADAITYLLTRGDPGAQSTN